jgi:iron(III) transport system ATP-binding protein
MYGSPKTLFTAEFMGSNNRLHGKVTEVRDGKAHIEGNGWRLWGQAAEGVAGSEATAVIRVERVAVVDGREKTSLSCRYSPACIWGIAGNICSVPRGMIL